MIRVLLADDHPLFRYGMRAVIATDPELQLVAEAGTGEEAVALAVQHEPTVVLMDLNMPGLNGIEATRKILAVLPTTGVLVVTMFDDDDSLFAAMRAGARGYLLKGADGDDTLRAIHAIAEGEAIFSPAMAQQLLGYFAAPTAGRAAAVPFPDLTEREREVLDLLAAGHSNAAIADRLVLTTKTVRNHVSNIFNKLQVADRAGAIVRARQAGLGS